MVLGDGGRLHGALAQVETGVVLVTATDRGRDESMTRIGRAAVADGRAWLPVAVELSQVVIGPLVRADGSGCAHCAARRRDRLRCGGDEERSIWQRHGQDLLGRVAWTGTETAVGTVAGLVSAELAAMADRGLEASRLNGAFLTVGLRELEIGLHAFLPDPHCEVCGGLRDDTEADAKIVLQPVPKPAVDVFRGTDLAEREDMLRRTYIDPVAGFAPGAAVTINSVFPLAEVPVTAADGSCTDQGYGHATDFRSTKLIALTEALERFGGRRPGAKRTMVRGSYRELSERAVDPRTLGMFDTDGHRCSQPYDEDLVFPWVYGFSFGREEPVLVPEQCAYFDSRLSPGERFVHDTSNGCALGGTLEEAILHGLLEIAERDAFLMTWYARMRVPRVDLDSLADTNCRFVLSHLRDRCGMRVHAFATILEQGIPCYWVMAVDTTGDPDKPQLLCGAGSGLTHETALVNAIRELAVMHSVVANNYADADKRRQAAAMVADSRLVRQMSDHTLLYSDRGARERLDFLTETPGAGRSVADFTRQYPWPASLDLRDDVTELVGRYVGSGLDVIVVDQTTAEHRAGGFHAVKVLVPGTLPMTFGHDNRRVAGLPRVLEVPAALGYRDRRLELDDLNPYPHPFP